MTKKELTFDPNDFLLQEIIDQMDVDVLMIRKNHKLSKEEKKNRISVHGITVTTGSENMYLSVECYNVDVNLCLKPIMVNIFSKENHESLKDLAIHFLKSIEI